MIAAMLCQKMPCIDDSCEEHSPSRHDVNFVLLDVLASYEPRHLCASYPSSLSYSQAVQASVSAYLLPVGSYDPPRLGSEISSCEERVSGRDTSKQPQHVAYPESRRMPLH